MATHKITLTSAQSPGPFDIYYRLATGITFVLFQQNVTDTILSNGLCVTLPDSVVEVKIVNKYRNSNIEIYKLIT